MKTIVAFIRPSKEEPVREALHDLLGVTGATFSDVRGFGRGRSRDPNRRPSEEAVLGTLPKVRVEVMAAADHAEAVAAAIAAVAKTGNRGDGKVYVLPVESALRISTGEIGALAV